MSSETLLIKDFREGDVNRIRNLVSGKFGDKTKSQAGYETTQVERKEGDVWEENNKTWTIKNGLKQTYTKLDTVKEKYRMPLSCPKCGGAMKHRLDKKLYPFHGMCYNCVVSHETKLKMEGKYEEYAKNIMKLNAYSFIEEAEQLILDITSEVHDVFVTADGDKEHWVGNEDGKEFVKDKLLSELDELRDKIEEI